MHVIILRGSDAVCGVQLVVDEFDIERSPNCREAYLELAGRRYCGSLDHGVQSEYIANALTVTCHLSLKTKSFYLMLIGYKNHDLTNLLVNKQIILI